MEFWIEFWIKIWIETLKILLVPCTPEPEFQIEQRSFAVAKIQRKICYWQVLLWDFRVVLWLISLAVMLKNLSLYHWYLLTLYCLNFWKFNCIPTYCAFFKTKWTFTFKSNVDTCFSSLEWPPGRESSFLILDFPSINSLVCFFFIYSTCLSSVCFVHCSKNGGYSGEQDKAYIWVK